ncbi:sugar kinase [Spongiibacter taiwanensis]
MPRVLCVGEVMVELSPSDSVLQPQPNAEPRYQLAYAGDTFNTAIHLARLGIPTGYLTELGTDRFSEGILALGRSEGLVMTGCVTTEGSMPGLYLIENDAAGERQFHYWRGQSAARNLFSGDEKCRHACALLSQWDAVYLSGITLAVMAQGNEPGFWRFIDVLRQQRKTLIFDPNFRPRLWPDEDLARAIYRRLLSQCDVLLPTLDDEAQLWGFDDPEALVSFYRAFGVAEVAMKCPGAHAMAWAGGEPVAAHSDYRGQVVDTTGAGDAFNGGYLAARLAGQSLIDALAAAHRVAATVVAVHGAIPAIETEAVTGARY